MCAYKHPHTHKHNRERERDGDGELQAINKEVDGRAGTNSSLIV